MERDSNKIVLTDYREVKALSFELELVSFVREYLRRFNIATISFYLVNITLVYIICTSFFDKNHSFYTSLWQLISGVIMSFLLIPIHELLHGLVYKVMGAKGLKFAADWRKLLFSAQANNFMISRFEFIFLAIFPFWIITSLLLIFLLFSGGLSLFYLGALLFHTSLCSGDFGLISFVIEEGDKTLITYDDCDEGISYFYIKKKD